MALAGRPSARMAMAHAVANRALAAVRANQDRRALRTTRDGEAEEAAANGRQREKGQAFAVCGVGVTGAAGYRFSSNTVATRSL